MVDEWENAYAEQMHDAALGRLFRGIIHNLNGLLQAFSMQSELFELMFQQADTFFSRIFNGTEAEKQEALEKLHQLLSQRSVLAEQLNEKVMSAQKLVQRTLSLRAHPATAPDSFSYPLADLIKEEMDFLCADSFFKHKVVKEVELEENLSIPRSDLARLRLTIQAVLHKTLESLVLKSEKPTLRMTARRLEKQIILEISNNGPPLLEDLQELMFSPFLSGRVNHALLGLFLARKSVELMGGEISAISREGRTSFVLKFPASDNPVQK